MATASRPNIPGYDVGTDKVAKSPVTLAEWASLWVQPYMREGDF
jgi:hypothetical protein